MPINAKAPLFTRDWSHGVPEIFHKKKITQSQNSVGWGRQEKIGSEKKAREKGHIQTKCIKETFLAASKHT